MIKGHEKQITARLYAVLNKHMYIEYRHFRMTEIPRHSVVQHCFSMTKVDIIVQYSCCEKNENCGTWEGTV
jgi:hypothetical protein